MNLNSTNVETYQKCCMYADIERKTLTEDAFGSHALKMKCKTTSQQKQLAFSELNQRKSNWLNTEACFTSTLYSWENVRIASANVKVIKIYVYIACTKWM